MSKSKAENFNDSELFGDGKPHSQDPNDMTDALKEFKVADELETLQRQIDVLRTKQAALRGDKKRKIHLEDESLSSEAAASPSAPVVTSEAAKASAPASNPAVPSASDVKREIALVAPPAPVPAPAIPVSASKVSDKKEAVMSDVIPVSVVPSTVPAPMPVAPSAAPAASAASTVPDQKGTAMTAPKPSATDAKKAKEAAKKIPAICDAFLAALAKSKKDEKDIRTVVFNPNDLYLVPPSLLTLLDSGDIISSKSGTFKNKVSVRAEINRKFFEEMKFESSIIEQAEEKVRLYKESQSKPSSAPAADKAPKPPNKKTVDEKSLSSVTPAASTASAASASANPLPEDTKKTTDDKSASSSSSSDSDKEPLAKKLKKCHIADETKPETLDEFDADLMKEMMKKIKKAAKNFVVKFFERRLKRKSPS